MSRLNSRLDKRDLQWAVCVAFAGFAPTAFAYLDPSTGSMILSAIVGVFATVGLAVKTYWYKLKSIFTGSKSESTDESSVTAESDLNSECHQD